MLVPYFSLHFYRPDLSIRPNYSTNRLWPPSPVVVDAKQISGRSATNLNKWRIASPWRTNHTVELCSLTCWCRPSTTTSNAVTWIRDVAMKTFIRPKHWLSSETITDNTMLLSLLADILFWMERLVEHNIALYLVRCSGSVGIVRATRLRWTNHSSEYGMTQLPSYCTLD